MRVPQSIVDMPRVVTEAITGADKATLVRRGEGGTFSLTEQACHLRDLEREGYLVRVRRILAENDPALAGFEGDVVARERRYETQDASAAVRDFTRARAELVALLATVDEVQVARTATFAGQRITLGDLVAMIEEHDGGHRDEIAALVAAQAR
jgi:hypothetical protein